MIEEASPRARAKALDEPYKEAKEAYEQSKEDLEKLNKVPMLSPFHPLKVKRLPTRSTMRPELHEEYHLRSTRLWGLEEMRNSIFQTKEKDECVSSRECGVNEEVVAFFMPKMSCTLGVLSLHRN